MDVTELTKTIIDEIINYYENNKFTCPISKDIINEPILKKHKFKPKTDMIKNYAFKNAIENVIKI